MRHIACALGLVVMAAGVNAQPADVSLSVVLDRLGSYIDGYARTLPATVATEDYLQTAGIGARYRRTHLESDFGIVRLPGVKTWLGFRDVLRRDGSLVAEHAGRLAAIFGDRGTRIDLAEQAARIIGESARYNIGPVERTINSPALALELLDPRNRGRFRFAKDRESTIDGERVWVIRFVEAARPTIILAERDNAPATGRAWVDPESGRLARVDAEFPLRLSNGRFVGAITVDFHRDDRLGIWVPASMIERYSLASPGLEIASGRATYSNYRIFSVETRESIETAR